MKNSANVIPGQFEAKGHDYRADLATFVREVYGLNATDEQLASIEKALRANELQRKAMLDAEKAATEKAATEKAATEKAAGEGRRGEGRHGEQAVALPVCEEGRPP